ncbi:L-glutamate gamma-semialdehyde dehydrogenase [Candidatus Uabimicrobium amorphum]|uniref:L-glutamate gamma-semialdehyde dehydrogenase n=1 Tax=Uabimicrobium amorphum TaxID=2596890 RepID=A0A5S9IIT2_UABAM|nr:L-glutamate gamma-semialdehyde dehydrogenase [Candidatus Uabimicrobium amorphum]BBM82464.1 1-pyrroline-5-carboxylate dehydrogenase [Candidatus Uabimicrobium amorphum]
MLFGNFNIPQPYNEPVKNYAPGSQERASLQKKYQELKQEKIEIPMVIDNTAHHSQDIREVRCPHDHQHVLATFHHASTQDAQKAIDSCLNARKKWSTTPFHHRASIFLKAAELISTKYRDVLNAATMLGQSKTCHQAEIDAACEFIDFLRFNVKYAEQIYQDQPISSQGIWNCLEYRPLEGFVLAITPFNFTAIAGNLCIAPAMMGNVILWKPSPKSIFSSHFLMQILQEAGLPKGVINMLPADGAEFVQEVIKSRHLSGIHFTGSTSVFRAIWKAVGNNIDLYDSYPRIVGETGGKDFMFVHKSANVQAVATAMIRGAFEFQGQKCSAASRAYIPQSMWSQLKDILTAEVPTIKVGDVEDFSNFMGAVIDDLSYQKISGYIDRAKKAEDCEVLVGGNCDNSKGYFVEPTILVTQNPQYETMVQEIFGPVLTVYVYADDKYEETLELCGSTSEYGLTGGIFASDIYAVETAYENLRDSAGNFYINDKVTGAVVGQQPFGGGRGSGTNDKAGSYLNLIRWVSPRSIKQAFCPPTDYRYPFLGN